MDKEKEIEAKEMAKKMCLGCSQIECNPDFGCVVYNPARRAVNAGYGNVKQAVKEFVERLKERQWFTVTVDKFVVCVDDIDNLLKEVCGDDCD